MPEGTEPQDCTEEKTTFTLTEFKELVHSAQKGDREAINVLCTAFKPLIYKEAYRYEVREALGEDAVNTAWLIFLEQIKKYEGRDFGHLPGLLQYYIHYGLLHKFTRGKSVKDCYYLDAEEEGEETQIADKKNDIDELMHNQLCLIRCVSSLKSNLLLSMSLFCRMLITKYFAISISAV